MSANGYIKYGTNLQFGLENVQTAAFKAATGLIPMKLDFQYSPEFEAQAQDENGREAAEAIGDDALTVTIEGHIQDVNAFISVTSFTAGGKFFRVKGRSDPKEIRQYNKATITAVWNPMISSVA